MGEESEGTTPFTLRFKNENLAFLRASGNVSQACNDLVEKVRGGQWVDIKAVKEGQHLCIYNMPDTQNQDFTCPIMQRYPELADKARLGDLLQCCRQCPRKAEYLAIVKLRTLYPTVFERLPEIEEQQDPRPRETAVAMAAAAPTLQAEQKHAPPPSEVRSNGRRVQCDTCHERFATFFEDLGSLDKLLETFEEHLKNKHGGRTVTLNEANQFRALKEKGMRP